MNDELHCLLKEDRIKVCYTKKKLIPYVLIDNEPICEKRLFKYGFKNFIEFEDFYKKIILK